MRTSSFFAGLFCLLALTILLMPHPAYAGCEPKQPTDHSATVICLGQPCDTVGRTALDGDSKSVLSCLLMPDGVSKVWRSSGCYKGVQSDTGCAPLPVCKEKGYFLQWTGNAFACDCAIGPEYRDNSCGVGYSGQVRQQRNYDCSLKQWSGWFDVSNTCTASCSWAWRDTGTTHANCDTFTYHCNGIAWAKANHPCGPAEDGHTVSAGRGDKPRYLCSCR